MHPTLLPFHMFLRTTMIINLEDKERERESVDELKAPMRPTTSGTVAGTQRRLKYRVRQANFLFYINIFI
jgi:hypothetical protein